MLNIKSNFYEAATEIISEICVRTKLPSLFINNFEATNSHAIK